MIDWENYLRQACPSTLSVSSRDSVSFMTSLLKEAISQSKLSVPAFIELKKHLDLVNSECWPSAVSQLLADPETFHTELVLLNLLQVSSHELKESVVSTLHYCYVSRLDIYRRVGDLGSDLKGGMKYALEVFKLAELWIEHIRGCDKYELLEVLLKFLRWLVCADFVEGDLRAKLISERISVPLSLICKNFTCFQPSCTEMLRLILPFACDAMADVKRTPSISFTALSVLLKTPEEGEIEESGIRDRFNYLLASFETYLRCPPHYLHFIACPTDSIHDRCSSLISYYSDILPDLSNSNWDARLIRHSLLSTPYTLKVIQLIGRAGPKVSVQLLDLLLSVLANLIGMWHKSQRPVDNTKTLVGIFSELKWVPALVGPISEFIEDMRPNTVVELLLIIWNYVKEHRPTEETGKASAEAYVRSLKLIIHKNIDCMGRLYEQITSKKL